MNATDQVLCDIEEGKSLAEAGGNAFVTLTYERFSDKAAGRLPTPGGDPADKVGFARKVKNGTSDSAKPTNVPHAGNVRKLSDKEWKRYGINPHVLKKEILGRKSPISHYDIAMDTSQKTADGYEIIIISHRTATEFSYIPTGVFIKKD